MTLSSQNNQTDSAAQESAPLSPGWTFLVLTFGCKINQYESQTLREAWRRLGGIETEKPEEADFILINSCAITGRAERNCRNAIFRMRQAAPGAKLILTGCAAQFYASFRPRKNANYALPDLCISQKDKNSLLAGPRPCAGAPVSAPLLGGYNRSRPVVKIQDGCLQGCSYCIVPQTRAQTSSRDPAEIIAECANLARLGFGEVVISGVNLRHYRGDFWHLIKQIDRALAAEFGAACRIRISSLDPGLLGDRALAAISECSLLCPHLHLSLQHASAKILAAMRRPAYSAEGILDFCARLREIWPDPGLGADIIAGFPGESEADLELLLKFISSARLTYAHVFPYSQRPGTLAAAMPGQIPKAEKISRAALVRETVRQSQLAFFRRQLAIPVMNVVTDKPDPDKPWRGVNEYYAPCVLDCAPPRQHTPGQIRTRPVSVSAAGLLVAPIP